MLTSGCCSPNFSAPRSERETLANVLGELFVPMSARASAHSLRPFPALNVWENENNLYLEAELPGFGLENLELVVLGNELTIAGSRPSEKETENVQFRRRERATGKFVRKIQLNSEVDADRVEAVLKNGVLKISLPKAESAKPRHITVRS